jgi:hypothetical protein
VPKSHAPDSWKANAAAVMKDVARRRRVVLAPSIRPDQDLIAEFVQAGRVRVIPRGCSGEALPQMSKVAKRGGKAKLWR